MLAKNERMKNGDRPAHPFNAIEHGYQPSFGLTKREYFAVLAMQGLTSYTGTMNAHNIDSVAKRSVEMADALLAELEKKER